MNIGNIANYYGGLFIKEDDNKFYWCIPNYDGDDWDEIPKYLYDTLVKYQEELKNE